MIYVAGYCRAFPSQKSGEELFEIFRLNLIKRNSTWKFGIMDSCGRILISLLLRFMEMCILTVSFSLSKPVTNVCWMVSVVIHEHMISRCTGSCFKFSHGLKL
jgi:hypothetical protein